MADYSFSPQFANLTGLQPLPAIDVTRGGALQFQALQPIQVVSSRPELVAEGIAGAVSNIAKGALSGITAKWEKEERMDEEERKFAQEEKIARIKAAQSLFEKGQQRWWEWEKMHEQDKLIKDRMRGVSPGKGFFGSEDAVDESGDFGTGDTSDLEGNLPESYIDPITGKEISTEPNLLLPSQEIPADGAKTSGIPISEQQAIATNVAMQQPSIGILSNLGAGTGPIPAPPKTEEKPSLTLQGIEPIVSPEKGQEIAQARLGLREAISEAKKPVKKSAETETLQAGFYPITSEAEANRILSTPLAENVHPPVRVVDSKTGKLYYEVTQMSPSQIAEKKRQQEEAESKIKSRQQYEGQKQERLYQQYVTAAQNEPSVKTLEEPKFGMAKFAAEIPEFYQQYKDYLAEAEKARQKGDTKSQVHNRQMVSETVNAMIDSFTRLASGKSVTGEQINLIKKEAIDPLQRIKRDIESWTQGGVIAPDEQVRSITKLATAMANEASAKANFFILGQREKFKEQGVPEKNLPKFYPQDVGFENEAKQTLASLSDDYEVKLEQYKAIKDSKNPKDEYKIDVLKKQLEILDYRIDSLNERIEENELLSKKGKKKQTLGHKEFVDRPTGLRDMYGISPFQQMMQQMSQSAAE